MRGLSLFVLALAGCTEAAMTPMQEDAASADAAARDAMPAPPGDDAAAVPSDGGVPLPDAAPVFADAAAPDALPSPDASAPPAVYVGSAGGDIHVFGFDPATGALAPRSTAPAGNNPSFLSAFGPHLYAVNEGQRGQVAAFAIGAQGALAFMNRVSSGGAGPAHLLATERFVLVAHYDDGVVTVMPVTAAGVGAPIDSEHPGDNAHQVVLDPAGRHVFVPCLGSDLVAQFAFDPLTGALTPNAVPSVASAAGAGPRHLAFHPNARWAYVINESDSTITTYDYDAASGRLTARPRPVSTLPRGFSGSNTTAEIAVHPSGRFVYGSNRGDDSIAAFSVDATTGELALLSHTPTGGSSPRSFALSPDGRILLVANQLSATVHALAIDPVTGAVTALGKVADVPRPAFVGFFTP